jgi:hypothetical protein
MYTTAYGLDHVSRSRFCDENAKTASRGDQAKGAAEERRQNLRVRSFGRKRSGIAAMSMNLFDLSTV